MTPAKPKHMIKLKLKNNIKLDAKKISEAAFLDSLIKKVPSVRAYKNLIRFRHTGSEMHPDFTALPTEVVQQIKQAFQKG